jgi:D-beta-D-heptose 7-phosphate kinase/D-beta-D-heptose 1-phosphate adenosyltransferase
MQPRIESPTSALLAAIERFRNLSVWVVGDLMLDEYLAGPVERISPEAPVPIVHVAREEERLGGAANVARQVARLGARVRLAGVVGSDGAGTRLLALAAAAGIDTSSVLARTERRTTRKLRVLGPTQQLLRVDWEDALPCTALAAELLERLDAGARPDVIIASDYAKGVLSDSLLEGLRSRAASIGCAWLVDPKRRDFAAYRGASVVTPNLRELEAAVGERLSPKRHGEVASAARGIMARAGIGALVITLGEHGMLVVPGSGTAEHVAGVRRAVYDVTGAGDTAIAVLALGVASQAGLMPSAQIANAAAGLAVGEVGTAAIDRESLQAALAPLPAQKVLSLEQLLTRAEAWRAEGRRIVFTNGCFDLLHAGHLALLHAAAAEGEVLVLAINSDASVRRLKGASRPLVPESERAALLAALACVDAVTIFHEDTPLRTIESLRPDVLVKGADYRLEQVVGRETVEAHGGRVALVPLLPQRSTTDLLERIRGRQGSA